MYNLSPVRVTYKYTRTLRDRPRLPNAPAPAAHRMLCYGYVTDAQNPLTNTNSDVKVTAQGQEGLGRPSTDTGTASHGMCAMYAENLRTLQIYICVLRGVMRPVFTQKCYDFA